MKTILTIVMVLVCTFVTNSQVFIHNNTHVKDSLIINTLTIAAKELNLHNLHIYISFWSFDKSLLNANGEGSAYKIDSTHYSINLDPELNRYETQILLIHELVHIKQMVDRRLVMQRFSNWFEGTLYTSKNSVYEERPYEKEAVDLSDTVYKKHKVEFKSF